MPMGTGGGRLKPRADAQHRDVVRRARRRPAPPCSRGRRRASPCASLAPWMTWKLVTTWPASSQTKPVPVPRGTENTLRVQKSRTCCARGDEHHRGARPLEQLDGGASRRRPGRRAPARRAAPRRCRCRPNHRGGVGQAAPRRHDQEHDDAEDQQPQEEAVAHGGSLRVRRSASLRAAAGTPPAAGPGRAGRRTPAPLPTRWCRRRPGTSPCRSGYDERPMRSTPTPTSSAPG